MVNARRRVERRGGENVQVLRSRCPAAPLEGTFDGLLMFAAPDVYGTREALDDLLPRLGPTARVVFFGPKTSRRGSGWA